MIIKHIEKRLSGARQRRFRNFVNDVKATGHGFNLTKLAEIYGTDKVGDHHYMPHYATHFKKYKFKRIKLLEIGVGGYSETTEGGHSLRMWKKYFPFGKIYSIDLYDKAQLQENRIRIFQGDQANEQFLAQCTEETGPLDIIIDDGSHINYQVIASFTHLFPKLKDGGIYVIEDTQTSYWPPYGGDSDNLNNPNTTMNFFKGLTDSLNNREFLIKGYKQSYFDKKIVSMHFYHNMIFIYKGNNDEESNIVVNNEEQ